MSTSPKRSRAACSQLASRRRARYHQPMSRRALLCALTLPLALGACQSQREPSVEQVGGATRRPSSADTAASIPDSSRSAPPQDTTFTGTLNPIQRAGPTAPPVMTLRAVRTAAHAGYDRVVFEFGEGPLPGYYVSYVDDVYACGSGDAVKVAGASRLSVRLQPAQAHDDSGDVTIVERRRRPALPTLRELTITCDFEAQVEWALGLAAQTPYRILELEAPPRLVLDIRHPR